jgi:type VI secretion system Hcp family effector
MRKSQSSAASSIKGRRLWSQSRLRKAVFAATPRPIVEPVEPRVMLSATMTYRPQKGDGTLDPAIQFQTGGAVQDFKAAQTSLLQEGFAAPAYNLFLHVNGITGESADAKHKGDIDLLAFNWGADASGGFASGGGAGTGKSTTQELHLVSQLSKASPQIVQSLANGTHHLDAKLVVRRAGKDQQEFLTIDLDDLLISSYQLTSANNGQLQEEFSLNFAKIEMEYKPQKADGTLDSPVKFSATAQAEDFKPEQRSILQDGFVGPASNTQYFLKINGVDGESQDAKHQDQIDVLSFGWGGDATAVTLGGGGGAGKTQFHEMHFVSQVSKASPKIMDLMAKGLHVTEAKFTAVKSGKDQSEFFTIDLDDLLVSSYQVKSTGGGQLLEEFTLNFSDFELAYSPQKADGSLDTPVKAASKNVFIEDFGPEQQSLLDTGDIGTGAMDVFLKVDGVDGETADSKHKGEIDVLSYSWGGDAVGGSLSGGGGGAGKTTLQELHVVSRLSKASPQIMQKVASGQHITQADLAFRRAGKDQQEFLRIDLDDVLIGGYQVTTARDGTLVEEYTLSFAKAQLAYSPQKDDGTLDAAIKFQEQGLSVEQFNLPEHSLIQTGYALPAGAQYFLNVTGIPGESTNSKQKDAIDILAFSWGEDGTSDTLGGGGGAGKTVFHEAHFVAPVSKASPKLMDALAKGMHIPDAVFHGLHGIDQMEFIEVKLTDIIVSSYQVVMGQHGQLVEEFTLNYANAFVEYTPQDEAGKSLPPVKFQALNVSTKDFKPEQRSLLHSNVETTSNVDAFLTVDGVQGESTSSKHKDAIDVLSFSWGGDGTATSFGGGGGAGKSTLQEFHVLTRLSKATPSLLDLMDDGRHVKGADLFIHRSGGDQQEFYKVKLEDLLVSSYQVTTAQDGTLLEEYTFNYAKAGLEYSPQKGDGTLDAAVKFNEVGLGVEQFAPVQGGILDTAPIAPLAGLDMFLDIDGIQGESSGSKHENQIEIESFSWGGDAVGSTLGGGGASAGQTRYQELHFVTHTSKATPPVLDRLMKGQHIPGAELAVVRSGGDQQEFLKIKLVDVIISSYKVTTGIDGRLVEEFTLAFGRSTVFGAPIADAGGPYEVGDGQTVTLDGGGSSDPDQDSDSLTYEWDLDGDGVFGETGTGAQRGDELGATPVFSAAGLFGPQTLTLTLRVTDGTGKTDTDTATLTIVDITPPETILLSGPPVLTNQTSATFTFTGTDQGTPADQLTFSAEIDGGSRVAVTSPLTLNNLADGVHTIKIYAKDQAGNEDPTPAEATWKVDTKGPAVLNASAGPAPAGSPIVLTATISDLLTGNSPIAGAEYSLDGITWLPMSAVDGTFNSPQEAVRVTFGPLPVGLYTVRVRGSDAAGNTGNAVTLDLPVFDPDSFVTGSGFIKAANGAKQQLNVNASYDEGDTEPSGKVMFQAGSINFSSTDLDYLLVTGNTARLAGTGTINGAGDYSFEAWLVDGNLGGGSGGDSFRIRIVNNVTGAVVFDNGALAAVQGGNLKIHS